ncbi:MAG: hypothetical protein RBS42_00425 [Campylobacterales bacterium]|nr:hypothetical protein [Campylobacterales bacterium]
MIQNLNIVGGFKNYKIEHETYALTRLIYFTMTGKTIIDVKFDSKEFELFVQSGLSDDLNYRYKSVKEMREIFNDIKFNFNKKE